MNDTATQNAAIFIPPSAVEYERFVIGLMISQWGGQAERVAFWLEPEHFFEDKYQLIFTTLKRMVETDVPIDDHTMRREFLKDNVLAQCGGWHTIADCLTSVTTGALTDYYCSVIIQQAILRNVIIVSHKLQQTAYESMADPFVLQMELIKEIESIAVKKNSQPKPVMEIAKSVLEKMSAIQASGKGLTGLDSGFKNLNEPMNGLQKSDLIIIAARPSVGKSSFVLNIANALGVQGIAGAVFSLEMSKEQLMTRVIAIKTGIDHSRLRDANLNEADWTQMINENWNLPIFIDDAPGLAVFDFKAKVRRLKQKHGIEWIMVDYLQLMHGEGKDTRERTGNVSWTLKNIAKELQVPVIALSQLSREVEKQKRRPVLSDLRENGNIEQDADVVVFLYDENMVEHDVAPNIEVIIAKNRHGKLKKYFATFYKIIQKFIEI